WITVERNGVNGNSSLPRDPDYYRQMGQELLTTPPIPVGRITPAAVRSIVWHHMARICLSPVFPGYRSHYAYGALEQAFSHVLRHVRLASRKRKQEIALRRALERTGPIFLGLLQRPGDSQLMRHSPHASVEEFVDRVVRSFAAHASQDAQLIFKGHPLDHG